MIKQLEENSMRVLEDYSDSIQSADKFKELLEIKQKIDSNPIGPKYLEVDDSMAELNIVTEAITKLNKKITKKLNAKGEEFGKQEYKRLQQFPDEEERRKMQAQNFQQSKDAFVAKKAISFEDLEKGVINNYFDVQKNYQSISKGIQEYIKTKVDRLTKHFEELDKVGTQIVEAYEKEVLSKLRPDKIDNIQDFPKDYILKSIDKVTSQI